MTGAAALYYLTANGCPGPVLIERDTLGSGSTSKAAGGVRLQFSDELNIRIGLENLRRFERFAEEPGGDIAFHQWGYLFLLSDAADVERFAASVSLQQSLGVPSRLLTATEAAEIVPGLNVEDVLAATFCPRDGYATPEAAVQGYARGRQRTGRPSPRGARSSGSSSTAAGSSGSKPIRAASPRSALSSPPASGRRRSARRPVSPSPSSLCCATSGSRTARRPATRAAADDRLLDRLLLPPGGAVAAVRRPPVDDRGSCAATRCIAYRRSSIWVYARDGRATTR